jgi:hypothetical protein
MASFLKSKPRGNRPQGKHTTTHRWECRLHPRGRIVRCGFCYAPACRTCEPERCSHCQTIRLPRQTGETEKGDG